MKSGRSLRKMSQSFFGCSEDVSVPFGKNVWISRTIFADVDSNETTREIHVVRCREMTKKSRDH